MSRKKVLLVDDSPTSVFMERMILRKGAFDVVVAADGQEGVDKAVAERPDLILMDMVMPRMSGLEAVRELRARAETRDIPIIMVTTRGEGDNVEKGFASGVNDYVTKPIDGVLLLAKIRDCLGT
ncbi:MAG TPA: response regulator [Vicinamibacteria bacterium]|nr:response regulator [Vicinamibacteria bacterium]